MPPAFVSVVVLLSMLVPAFVHASEDLDTLCLDCHRPAQDRGAVPVIEGQHADYLRAQLQRFHDRHREGFPMNALSAGMQQAQIEALADALAARPWQPARLHESAETDVGRERIEALECGSCHGADFNGGGIVPRLAGQQAAYLERQILSFGDAQRHHPPVGGGARMYTLVTEEAAAIAQALAAMR